jgi:hypothetical protein
MTTYVRIIKVYDVETDDDQTYQHNIDRVVDLESQGALFSTFDVCIVDGQGKEITEKQFEKMTK